MRSGILQASNTKTFLVLFLILSPSVCLAESGSSDDLITFGLSQNLKVEFGKLSYGVAQLIRAETPVVGLNFRIQGHVPDNDRLIVYGWDRSKDGSPEVWRAYTKDGFIFEHSKMLFTIPASDKPPVRWIAGSVAMHDDTLVLLQSAYGNPPMKGHPFHAYGGKLDGTDWKKLNVAPIYRGQDAFSVVWNNRLGQYVNYQTSYQPYAKRYPDNLPKVRRVLHIRASPDGVHWTPHESFGADGPYLPNEYLISPDETDPPDKEFYKFSAIDLGECWAGIMVNYVSQPSYLATRKPWPHGPFLDFEWWISADGLRWERPFRETSGLDRTPFKLAYHLAQPIRIGDELRWVSNADVYTLNRRRMFYAYSRANAEVVTRTLRLTGRPISVEVSFESAERQEGDPLRQGYLMAELLDENGDVIQGFERSKCILLPDQRTRLDLKWGDRYLPEDRLNRSVCLRLCFRDVRIYSVAY